MKRREYMEQLQSALQSFDAETRSEILANYEEHFQIGLQEGKSEDALVMKLGSIDELVEELKQLQGTLKDPVQETSVENYNATDMLVPINNEQDKNQEGVHQADKAGSNVAGTCSCLVLEPIFAEVRINRSVDKRLHISYRNSGSENQKKLYQFYHYQEGETVYAGVKKTNYSSYLLQSLITPHIVLEVEIPLGMKSVEVKSVSGDIECSYVDALNLSLCSLSGSLTLQQIDVEELLLKTTSGDIDIHELEVKKTARFSSKSGSISMNRTYGNDYRVTTLSGDVDICDGRYTWSEFKSTSGDTNLQRVFSDAFFAGTISGDVNAKEVNGNAVEGSSKSGDIKIISNAKEIKASSISGDVEVMGIGTVTATLTSVSGDVGFEFITLGGGYHATIQTVSGSVDLFYNKERVKNAKRGSHLFGNGEADLRLKTVSGDIQLKG